MKASQWIHRRALRTHNSMSDNEKLLDCDPSARQATMLAILDYLDETDGPFSAEVLGSPDGPTGPTGPAPTAPGANGPAEPSVPKMLSLNYYRRLARDIWGPPELNIQDIVIRLGVDYGKLARFARGATKDPMEHEELERTFGNIIFSMIRWADDLGLDLGRCMGLAIKTQQKFVRENTER